MSGLVFDYKVNHRDNTFTATCMLCGQRQVVGSQEEGDDWGRKTCASKHERRRRGWRKSE